MENETLAALLARLERLETIVSQLYDHENPFYLIEEIDRESVGTAANCRKTLPLSERASIIKMILEEPTND